MDEEEKWQPPPFNEQIDEIMDNFDFAAVRRCMERMGWTWAKDLEMPAFTYKSYVPDEAELRQVARECLKMIAADDDACSSGGTGRFIASKCDGCLSLSFSAESWEIGP